MASYVGLFQDDDQESIVLVGMIFWTKLRFEVDFGFVSIDVPSLGHFVNVRESRRPAWLSEGVVCFSLAKIWR